MPVEQSSRTTTETTLRTATEPQPVLHDVLGDLVQASSRLVRIAAHATGSSESPAKWRTLSVLRTSGSMRLGELAAHSRVSQPTMTKIVAGLVETNWIQRVADADDARAWQIAITPTGVAALDGWRDQLVTALMPLFSDVTESETDALRRAVDIVKRRVELGFATSTTASQKDAK